MATDTYEVLYNSQYGEFSIPIDVCEEMFKRFPPGTKIGDSLFDEDVNTYYIKDDQIPDSNLSTQCRITRYEDFSEGFKRIYYTSYRKASGEYTNGVKSNIVTNGTKYYSLQPYPSDEWRTQPEVIQYIKEKGYIGKKIGYTTLQIASIPVGYSIGLNEYDGQEDIYPLCPTVEIIADLLEIIKNGSKESMNCLTQRLLDGAKLMEIVHPKV